MGLLFTAGGAGFSFNASHYCEHDMDKADYPYQLTKLDETIVHIDYRNSAVGSNSCGPQLQKKHRIDETEFTFEAAITPVFIEA
jgi:beta-galactosidase